MNVKLKNINLNIVDHQIHKDCETDKNTEVINIKVYISKGIFAYNFNINPSLFISFSLFFISKINEIIELIADAIKTLFNLFDRFL